MNEYELSPMARVRRFDSFSDAYSYYGVRSGTGATYKLAKAAVKEGGTDLIVVYDELILVNPDVISYVDSQRVTPENRQWNGGQS